MSEDLKHTHVCVDKIIPLKLDEKAEQVAIAENPNNAPASDPNANERLALVTRKMWKPGRTLRVSFLDGSNLMREKVKYYASVWMQYANVKLVFGDDEEAEIRISFRADPGSWSAVGTDALITDESWFPPGTPTMNYGWLTDASDDEEYSRVVVHEFGHALGCIHEHQGPKANIRWNKPVVYDYFHRSQGWSREDVDHNLFNRYSEEVTQFTNFDPKSIMIYHIPKEFTLDGVSYPTNTVLSQTDIDFIGRQYPKG